MGVGQLSSKLRTKSIAALLLLGFLWAALNLRPDLLPGLVTASLPYFASHALPLFLFAAIAAISARLQGARPSSDAQAQSQIQSQARMQTGTAVLIGITLFALPAIVHWLSRNSEPNSARTALFCLVPVFTAVFQPYLGTARAANNHALPATLVAFMGALCILPIDYPRSPHALFAFATLLAAAASVGAGNCLAEAAANSAKQEPRSFTTVTAIAALTGALTLAAASAILDRDQWSNIAQRGMSSSVAAAAFLPAIMWAIFADLPALLLLFWLMRRLSAIRLSTRYLLAPLLTILVGIAFLRLQNAIQPRTWLGLLLIACGVAYLILAPDSSSGLPPTIFPATSAPPGPESD